MCIRDRPRRGTFREQEVDDRKVPYEGHPVGKELEIGLGHKSRAFFIGESGRIGQHAPFPVCRTHAATSRRLPLPLPRAQVQVVRPRHDVTLRERGHGHIAQQAEQQGRQLQVVIRQKFVTPAVERLQLAGIVVEKGGGAVGRDERDPMPVLPPFGVCLLYTSRCV